MTNCSWINAAKAISSYIKEHFISTLCKEWYNRFHWTEKCKSEEYFALLSLCIMVLSLSNEVYVVRKEFHCVLQFMLIIGKQSKHIIRLKRKPPYCYFLPNWCDGIALFSIKGYNFNPNILFCRKSPGLLHIYTHVYITKHSWNSNISVRNFSCNWHVATILILLKKKKNCQPDY